LRIDRADVFGVSLGGMIAQEFALGWPERLRKLVLGCTQAGFAAAHKPDRDVGLAFVGETDDWNTRMRRLAPFAFGRSADGEAVEAFIAKKARDLQSPESYAAQLAAVALHDAHDRVAEIAAPTLVITGSEDQIIPPANSRVLADRIPGSVLHICPGAGHLFFREQPAETARVLEGFLG
jgi:3-oxoadipate enol-lactonase